MSTGNMLQSANTASPDLQALVGAIFDAYSQAPADRLPHAVGDALLLHADRPGLLSPAQREGNDDRYTRHVLYAHPQGCFTLVALVWQPGQMSPVHGHYTWCAYSVLAGTLHEELFDWRADIERAALRSCVMHSPGNAVGAHAGLDTVHRIRNNGNETAISLHVYGVDGSRISTHVNRLVRMA